MLALRLPLRKEYRQKEVIVYTNEWSESRIALSEVVGSPGGPSSRKMQLPVEQWAAIDTLREEWCTKKPEFVLQQDAPFYDVGLRCEYSGSRSSRRVMVPMGELPDALQDVLHLFGLSVE